MIHGGTPEGGLPEDSKFVKSLFSKLEIGRTTDEVSTFVTVNIEIGITFLSSTC